MTPKSAGPSDRGTLERKRGGDEDAVGPNMVVLSRATTLSRSLALFGSSVDLSSGGDGANPSGPRPGAWSAFRLADPTAPASSPSG